MEELLLTEIWTVARTNHGCVVFLRPKEFDVAVPIIIGELELHSIVIGREGIPVPRPLTHDMLLNILRHLRVTLRQVEIHSLIDDTFHARLILEGMESSARNTIAIDCRPSDAIALAVRKKCPIYLTSKLVKKTGIPLDFFLDEIEESTSHAGDEESAPQIQYRQLSRQLNRAVEAEEY
jgi:bifunctional DNase/RNase